MDMARIVASGWVYVDMSDRTRKSLLMQAKTPGGNGWGYMWNTDRIMVTAMEEG